MDEYERRFLESMRDQRVGGRYVIERVLGSGGMGLVAAARHPELGQEVAIKFMRSEIAGDSTLSARFLREARIAARTRSPHFVRVFDFGLLESGVPYLVMEMLEGRDLGALVEERGPLPIVQAVDYLLQAMEGLAEIHAQGVVHRDLKPANLYVAEAAGTRTVKVLDLGLSKDSTAGLTSTGHSFGTPHYMSPEQIRESKSVDTRSDIWAIGVILYELLTQKLPYGDGATATGEVFGAVLHTNHVPLRARKEDLPEELERIIGRCLMREPKDRFQDLAALAEALRPFADAATLPRIDVIREALRVPLDVTRLSGPEKAAPPAADAPSTAKPMRAQSPQQPVSPAAASAAVPAAPGQSEMVAVRANWPAPAAAQSAVRGSSARNLVLVAGSVAIVVAAGTLAAVKLGSSPSRASAAAAAPSSVPSAAETAAAEIPMAPATTLPGVSLPPLQPAVAPSASAAASASATAVAPSRAPARPVATGHAGSSVLDGLDRK